MYIHYIHTVCIYIYTHDTTHHISNNNQLYDSDVNIIDPSCLFLSILDTSDLSPGATDMTMYRITPATHVPGRLQAVDLPFWGEFSVSLTAIMAMCLCFKIRWDCHRIVIGLSSRNQES